jgi:hypothetical protein
VDRISTRRRVRSGVLVLAALGLAVPLALTGAIEQPDGTAEALPSIEITIDLLAAESQVIGYAGVLRLNGDVHWRNRSGGVRTVTSPDGILDSDPIPDGGSFHASFPVPGTYTWNAGNGT